MESIPNARYDHIADYYDERMGDNVTEASVLLDLLEPIAGKRILDLACGQGRVTRELARRDAGLAVGLDISPRLIAIARERHEERHSGVRYVVGDASAKDALREDGGLFDAVVCHMALTDFQDLDGALATVARVTVDGGSFVFSMLHPCFPGIPDRVLGSWDPTRGYRAEGWWSTGGIGIRGKVGSYHRSLATILNMLIEHGLLPRRIVEPTWSMGPELPELERLPAFLVVCAARRRDWDASPGSV
jgi:SAM-dependent methyltransferase